MVNDNQVSYNAALYCRLSKEDEQAGESVSIETQRMVLTNFCFEHGFNIYDIYIDDGFSGLNYDRPAFTQLLQDIEKGRVNLVITKDLSRLGRDYIQTGYYTDIYFSQKNVRYIAVNDGIDTSKDDNDIAPFKNILNDMYAKDLSRKVKLARRQRAYQGYFMSAQTPFGYKVDPNDKRHLIVDEEAAEIVRKIFKLALEGNSYLGISRKLTELKIITPGAYKFKNGDTKFIRYLSSNNSLYDWSYQTVRTILLDSVYKGNMVNHKTEIINYKTKQSILIPREEYIIVENMHEPIIDPEEFEKVQKILNSRERSQNHNFENIFKGKVFCSECGTPMIQIAQQNRNKTITKPLLKCFNHYKNPKECTSYHAVLYDDLYEEVLKRIQLIFEKVKESSVFEDLEAMVLEKIKNQKTNEEKLEIIKQITSIKKNIADVSKTCGNKVFKPENVLSDIIHKQHELTNRLAKIERGEITLEIERKKIKDLLNKILTVEKLNEDLVNNLIERIEVGAVIIAEDGPKREIFIKYKFGNID